MLSCGTTLIKNQGYFNHAVIRKRQIYFFLSFSILRFDF
ncbi:MAG: hypothetical protein [Olavius algarvensis Gamma 1 endosymbiont]|nr:MAG: hypothetical protein [Olavius algarvensis Gamma 1 endosymbiont]